MARGGLRIVPAIAALMLPLAPLAAQVSDAECATLRLLGNSESDLGTFSLQYRSDGKIDLRVGGKADTLGGATECETGGMNDFSLDCHWRSDMRAEAQTRFNQFRTRIDRCLPWAEMKAEKDTYASTSLKVLERYSGDAGGDEYGDGAVDIELQLVEYTQFDGGIYYWVGLELQH